MPCRGIEPLTLVVVEDGRCLTFLEKEKNMSEEKFIGSKENIFSCMVDSAWMLLDERLA